MTPHSMAFETSLLQLFYNEAWVYQIVVARLVHTLSFTLTVVFILSIV